MADERYPGESREEELQRRRQEQKIRRQKQVKRQKAMLMIGAGAVVAALFGVIAVMKWNEQKNAEKTAKKVQGEKQEEVDEAKKILTSFYDQFAGTTDESGFADWVALTYPLETKQGLVKAVQDGTLTDEEIYNVYGATMHVLSDGYEGKLADSDTAEKNRIYRKDGDKAGMATVTVAGDLCLEEDGFVLDRYDESDGLADCISQQILDVAKSADIFYLNHEYTITDKGEPLEGKEDVYRAKPERMELLEEMGVDLVSLANNHVYDYGEEGFLDTLTNLKEASINYVGAGKNAAEAEQPVYYIINGIKVGFVAASNAETTKTTPAAGENSPGILEAYDTTDYNEIIKKASTECDYLIAYIHWGTENTNDHSSEQREQGKEFLESGADIVIGGHPHLLQGIEYIDGKPLVYSMGDLWVDGETKYTGLLNLEITPEGLEKMSFTPCQHRDYTTNYFEDEEGQTRFYNFLKKLSPNISIDKDGGITEEKDDQSSDNDAAASDSGSAAADDQDTAADTSGSNDTAADEDTP